VAAPNAYAGAFAGNTALAVDPWASQAKLNDTQDLPLLPDPAVQSAQPASNVIAFTEIQRQAGRVPIPVPLPPPAVAIPPSRPVAPQQRKKPVAPKVEQAALDFTPVAAAPPRTLTNGIPATNHCQRPVATVAHRFFASVVDVSMILLGFGAFAGTTQAIGWMVGAPEILGEGHSMLMTLGAFFLAMTTFYGLIWLFAERESAGMRMAGLELVTFDNAPLDMRTRLIRMGATWISIGAGAMGVIWAIADEEHLTWQDHISSSFPTFREREQSFVRQPR
jgi:uncharacterized RDD family membrane protein YckC